jgi:hypothetical protein
MSKSEVRFNHRLKIERLEERCVPAVAAWSDAFVDAYGVNTHWSFNEPRTWTNGVYGTQATQLMEKLGQLGFRHERNGLIASYRTPSGTYPNNFLSPSGSAITATRHAQNFGKYGIKVSTVLQSPDVVYANTTGGVASEYYNLNSSTARIDELLNIAASAPSQVTGANRTPSLVEMFDAIEGPNEWRGGSRQTEFSGTNWATDLKDYMEKLNGRMRYAGAPFVNVPIAGPSLVTLGEYQTYSNLFAGRSC